MTKTTTLNAHKYQIHGKMRQKEKTESQKEIERLKAELTPAKEAPIALESPKR